MKKTWLIRKDSEAVSPVIATILMVAITVVLAAVLYVMVLGFGGTSTTTPAATYSKATITYGQKITIISITKTDVPWDDVKIQLSDGTTIVQWSPAKANQLTSTAYNYSTNTLGGVTVVCVLTDVSGNGYVSGTDYFTLKYQGTAFSSSTTYTAVLLYKVTGERCGQGVSFTG
jgi:flagellin-like protein